MILRRRLLRLVIGSVVLLSSACSESVGPGGMSSEASEYLSTLTWIMSANSVNRFLIDWDVFRDEVFIRAEGARTIPDTYPAIRHALRLLGDNHSYFLTRTNLVLNEGDWSCPAPGVTSMPHIPQGIGYIKVESFPFLGSTSAGIRYAEELHAAMKAQDGSHIVGWVVDVRGNTGGNVWPMIAGLGPLLGEGVVAHFIFPDGRTQPLSYEGGEARLNEVSRIGVRTPHELAVPMPRVAVLIDGKVASSGEAVAIAFRGREGARSFGSATCGLSTSNQVFNMRDGAKLILTTATTGDRLKRKYGAAVEPDEWVEGAANVVNRAVAWLQEGN